MVYALDDLPSFPPVRDGSPQLLAKSPVVPVIGGGAGMLGWLG